MTGEARQSPVPVLKGELEATVNFSAFTNSLFVTTIGDKRKQEENQFDMSLSLSLMNAWNTSRSLVRTNDMMACILQVELCKDSGTTYMFERSGDKWQGVTILHSNTIQTEFFVLLIHKENNPAPAGDKEGCMMPESGRSREMLETSFYG